MRGAKDFITIMPVPMAQLNKGENFHINEEKHGMLVLHLLYFKYCICKMSEIRKYSSF